MRASILATLLAFAAVNCAAQIPNTILATVEPWRILQTKNLMTDKVSCFAIHTQYPNVQFSPPAIYIDMSRRGGLKGYTYRVDDLSPSQFAIATGVQVRLNTLVFGEGNLPRVNQNKRLRVQVLTVLDTVSDFDLNMSSAEAAQLIMASEKCT